MLAHTFAIIMCVLPRQGHARLLADVVNHLRVEISFPYALRVRHEKDNVIPGSGRATF